MTDMEMARQAKEYIDKLAQGIDPVTGRELPEDSPLNHVRLARCFFYVSDILQQVIKNGGTVGRKTDFCITPAQLQQVPISREPLRISQIVDNINTAACGSNMKKLGTTTITNWLLKMGFLEKRMQPNGKCPRVPTRHGAGVGISTQMRQGRNGEYLAVLYDAQAQRFILDNLEMILLDK